MKTWAKEIFFCTIHAPGARSLAQSVVLQPSALSYTVPPPPPNRGETDVKEIIKQNNILIVRHLLPTLITEVQKKFAQ